MKIQPSVYLVACGYEPLPKKAEMNGWRQEPITQKQKNELEKHGVAYGHIKYKGQASKILSIIYKRNENKLATPKQIQVLLKNGYAIGRIKLLTKKGASLAIAKILAK